MSICIAVPKHLIFVLPFSHVNTGIQGPINIIISLHRKNYVIITIDRLIVMAALRSRREHYIFALWFLSIFLFSFLA